jgi:hypothetical protein
MADEVFRGDDKIYQAGCIKERAAERSMSSDLVKRCKVDEIIKFFKNTDSCN